MQMSSDASVVPGRLVPHVVRHRVIPADDAGDSVGQRQRRPLGISEEWRVAPGRYRVDKVAARPQLPAIKHGAGERPRDQQKWATDLVQRSYRLYNGYSKDALFPSGAGKQDPFRS